MVWHGFQSSHDLSHLGLVSYLHLLMQQHLRVYQTITGDMAEGYHLVRLQPFEEAAVVGGDIVGIDLSGDALAQLLLEVSLRWLEPYFVCLVGEEQVEIVDAKAVHLDEVLSLEVLQDVEHAIDAIEGVERWIIHHRRSN